MNAWNSVFAVGVFGVLIIGCQQTASVPSSVVRLDEYRLLATKSGMRFANGFFRDLKAADGRALKVEDFVSKAHNVGKRAIRITSASGAKTTLSFISAGKLVAEGKDGVLPVTSDAKGVKSVSFDGSLVISRQVDTPSRYNPNRLLCYGDCLRVKDEAHVREAKECGFDFFWNWPDIDTPQWLGWLAKYNLGTIANHPFPEWCGGNGQYAGKMRTMEKYTFDKFVDGVKNFAKFDSPAVWKVNLVDEPSAKEYPYLAEICDYLIDRLPGITPFIVLYPNYAQLEATKKNAQSQLGTKTYDEYIEQYCLQIPLDYIEYDFYPIYKNPKKLDSMMDRYYSNFEVVSKAARETGRDVGFTAQLNSHKGDGDYFTTLNQLRFQMYHAMAFGATVLGWACYSAEWWENNALTRDGRRTEQYDKAKKVNAEFHAWNDRFMAYRNVATHYANLRGAGAITAAGIAGLRTTEDTPLVAGEMVPWNEESGLTPVLFVTTAGDVHDKIRTPRTLVFRTASGKTPKVWTPQGELALTRVADGTFSFKMAESSAVMLGFE